MKPTLILSAPALTALLVLAMGKGSEAADTDADGMLTLEEVQAAYPEVCTDMFLTMDLKADGSLNPDEVAAAQDAGLMPPAEG